MLRKLEYICLVGSIGLIGADRIDLAAGNLPFILNPFLILAPLVVLLHFLRTTPQQFLQITVTPALRRQLPFIGACLLFLAFAFASVPIGLDPERGLVAFSDMALIAVLGYYILVRVLTEPKQGELIRRSVTFALIAYILFCVGEFIAWRHGWVIDVTRSGSWLESTFAPGRLWLWAPTLSGTTFDSNRAGFILTMYLVLLDRFAAKEKVTPLLRFTIAVLAFLALSRSAALCWLAYNLFSAKLWARLASRRMLLRVAVVVALAVFLAVMYQGLIMDFLEASEILDAASTKLSMGPGSSGESHVLLIERGFDTWLTSPKTIISGIGFASAPKVVGDFFGTDKHGNFHCLYITALAEMGLPAFLTLMFMLGYPVVRRTGTIQGIAALMIFNVSYQVHMEPMFWLILALMWSYERRQRQRLPSGLADNNRYLPANSSA